MDPAVSYMFKVQIDDCKLGLWHSFEGLGWEITMETREEGGNNFFVHQLPGRLKYSNLKMGRPLSADSTLVANWFASMATCVKRSNGFITALGPDAKPIVTWTLVGVVPVKWTGPSFNVETLKVATETLELAYHGFEAAAKPGGR